MKIGLLQTCGLLLLAAAANGQSTSSCARVDGKIGTALFRIAEPAAWNGDVLIYAHGLRVDPAPLSASFPTNDALFKALSAEGWLIAATSYRRNGYIIREGAADLDALRRHIIQTYGMPKRIFLEGTSMGGAIVTRMAETQEGDYTGALAVGAVLVLGQNPYNFAPKMPLLMLSNQSEFKEPLAYAAKAGQAPFPPARWIVKRDGHCNVTAEERLAALRALIRWSESGAIELERDGTVETR